LPKGVSKEFLNAKKKITERKNKGKNTLDKSSRATIQRFLDDSPEKRDIFMKVLTEYVDADTGKQILDKGVIVYVRLIDSLKTLENDLTEKGIPFKSISGKTSTKQRDVATKWFNSDPSGKVVFITDGGSASINLHSTNELIFYTLPEGYRGLAQARGRVCRGFGKYSKYNIHIIQVEDSYDEYAYILQSSRKEVEQELLNCDSIPVKEVGSFNAKMLKRIRDRLLWKKKK
jgi:SNF2 family DNA or RNA helicase